MSDRSRRRPRLTILVKLLVAFTLPTIVLFAVFAYVAYEFTRQDLEAELGKRLEAVAAAASTQVRGKYLVPLGPGDDDDELRAGVRGKLDALKNATGVERIYVFDSTFRSRVDTDDVSVGEPLFQAEIDRPQIEAVLAGEGAQSSVLFTGAGEVPYKAGYAAIYNDPVKDREVVLVVGVDAPADFFVRLGSLRRNLVLYGVAIALVVMIIAVFVAMRLTRPIRALAEAAERIGHGELDDPIEVHASDEVGLLASTMDTMRTELRARDERMQLMLSGIAHEVRNPLGGIELFAGILRDELDADDERLAHVQRIEREVGYLGRVVSSFLEYARRPAPQLTRVDLGDMVRDLCELEAKDAEELGVELRCEADRTIAMADPDQLRRVVLNIVRNAMQAASSADGDAAVVTVRSGESSGSPFVAVHNTGAPIPEEALSRLFEPFYTTREKGTGLGLALSHEIAVAHGGTIEVESSTDSGTTFTVRLPSKA